MESPVSSWGSAFFILGVFSPLAQKIAGIGIDLYQAIKVNARGGSETANWETLGRDCCKPGLDQWHGFAPCLSVFAAVLVRIGVG